MYIITNLHKMLTYYWICFMSCKLFQLTMQHDHIVKTESLTSAVRELLCSPGWPQTSDCPTSSTSLECFLGLQACATTPGFYIVLEIKPRSPCKLGRLQQLSHVPSPACILIIGLCCSQGQGALGGGRPPHVVVSVWDVRQTGHALWHHHRCCLIGSRYPSTKVKFSVILFYNFILTSSHEAFIYF